MAGKRKGNDPEYVIICREFNRPMGRIDISVIDSGVTDHLMQMLVWMHRRDPHKRYFLTTKKAYQKNGPLLRLMVERMQIKDDNGMIVEIGGEWG